MEEHHYFPLLTDLTEKKFLVIGSGHAGMQRVRALLGFTRHLYVLTPGPGEELLQLASEGRLTLLRKNYEREDLFPMDYVTSCTGDDRIDTDVYVTSRTLGIRVNLAGDPGRCDFFFPDTAGSPSEQ